MTQLPIPFPSPIHLRIAAAWSAYTGKEGESVELLSFVTMIGTLVAGLQGMLDDEFPDACWVKDMRYGWEKRPVARMQVAA